MKISGAIFDMDGTVTDSMYVWKDIGLRYLQKRGVVPRPTLWQDIKNMSLRETTAHFREVYGITETDAEIAQGINSLVEPMYRTEILPKSGIIELLEDFRARGIPMALATATDSYLAEATLQKNDLRKYFKGIFTCTGVGAGKTDPTIYEAALKCLGTPKAETLVFEDAYFALTTAKRAGFPTVGVYDESQDRDRAAMERDAEIFVTDYRTDMHYFQ